MITELARLRPLVVRPSSAIAKYLGYQKDPIEAGRELRVKAVLAANFLHARERVRVTAQLLDVANGRVLWADRIDSDAGDIITVQDIIVERIVDGLQFAYLRNTDHSSVRWCVHFSGYGRIPCERLMRSDFMVVTKVFSQYSPQVFFAKNNHQIKALSPNASDQSFGERILPR